jgi:hypothetical protein
LTPLVTACTAPTRGRSGSVSRAGLVVTEIALAFVLLIGWSAHPQLRSLAHRRLQAGSDADRAGDPADRQSRPKMRGEFWEQLVTRLQAMPGVTTVVASNALPFSQWEWQSGFRSPAVSSNGTIAPESAR